MSPILTRLSSAGGGGTGGFSFGKKVLEVLIESEPAPAPSGPFMVLTSKYQWLFVRSSGVVSYEIDWGDGTVENLTTNNAYHDYGSSGTYRTITITPDPGSTFRPRWASQQYANTINSIAGYGGTQLGTDLSYAFAGMSGGYDSGMTSFPSTFDVSHVTNFAATWSGMSGLTSFPALDVSSGTNFASAWNNCSKLTSFPTLDVSSGTGGAFNGTWTSCYGLTSFPTLNVSGGTQFFNTWGGCYGLTSFPLLNFSNATSLYWSWSFCSGLTSFPQIDTSNVTELNGTWLACNSLANFPVLNFSSVTDTADAWADCALTAQSIENILVALDNGGVSNLSTSIGGGTSAGYSTWSSAAQTALSNLQGKGWSISYNA